MKTRSVIKLKPQAAALASPMRSVEDPLMMLDVISADGNPHESAGCRILTRKRGA
jgi:hypothetical protein